MVLQGTKSSHVMSHDRSCDIFPFSGYFTKKLGDWCVLARNHFQRKHLRMVNMLTDRIETLNGINNMEQSAETSKLDK